MGNTPNIRFKGFTDDWEQRKLGEVFQEYSEKNHPELPALTIIQGGGTVLREESERKLQYDKSSLAGYKMVREDDFIVHLRSFEGGLEKSNHNGLISPAYHTFHGDEVDSRFYYPYFRSYEFIKHKLVPHVYGIRDGRSIDIDSMKTIEIPWTSYEEQKKIGDYIESLDTLITLHQRKCDETKKLKKFMLQKMFPKKDAKKPEIRFAGFTDDWEQRKFGSLLKEIREKTKIENEDTLLSCAIDGMYLNSELFSHFRGSSNIGYLKVKKNDLILSAQNLHLGNCNVNLRFEHGIISPAYKVYELVTCDPFFIQAWVKQDSTKDFFLNASTEGASVCRKNIVWDELYKQTLPIPKLKEQEQIGQYFNELDNLITLHQRKLFLNFAKRNDWEQRKFGDIGSIAMCKRIFKEQTSDEGEVPFYKIGTFGVEPDAFISKELFDEYKTKYPYPNKGDILISASGSIGRTVEFTGKDEYFQDSNIVWLKHGNEIDNSFLKVLYSIVEWSCEGSTIKRLYNDNFLKTEFMLPQIDEQIKLGTYFSNLDNLITLHRRAYYNKKGGLTNVHNDNQQHYAIL